MVQRDETQQNIYTQPQVKASTVNNTKSKNNNSVNETKKKIVKKCVRKRYKKIVKTVKNKTSSEVKAGEGVEGDAQEVRARFQLGCECQDDRCFKGLNPENVYK